MAHQLLLEIPEEVYTSLVEKAKEEGQSPEVFAVEQLAAAVRDTEEDPLLKWIGAFSSDVPGWADQHDKYIGEEILRSMHDTQPESSSNG